ncbi:hypothetical protein C4569_02705 [Candidatus Parcubacteria bacterium]|nr:MAG: hypothetical protein C4569_02705 [Candidatus Parcubacteria bacterium]
MKRIINLIFIAGVIVSLAIAVSGKIKGLGRFFLAEDYSSNGFEYGNLYLISGIKGFKQNYKLMNTPEMHTVNNAGIITMGDSFFNQGLDSDIFANELEKKIDLAVYNIADAQESPLQYFKDINYKGDEHKVLLFEITERSTLSTILSPKFLSVPDENLSVFYRYKEFYYRIKHKIFNNLDVEYFFKRNFIANPVRQTLKNIKFSWFGLTDPDIGAYSEDLPMLFFETEVSFNEMEKSDANLEALTENLKLLQNILLDKYNIDLYVLIIPNQYTIYSKYANKKIAYDGYLAKINGLLDKKGVKYFDVYGLYRDYVINDNSRLLYLTNDFHYSAFGKLLLVNSVAEKLSVVFK